MLSCTCWCRELPGQALGLLAKEAILQNELSGSLTQDNLSERLTSNETISHPCQASPDNQMPSMIKQHVHTRERERNITSLPAT